MLEGRLGGASVCASWRGELACTALGQAPGGARSNPLSTHSWPLQSAEPPCLHARSQA